MSEVLRADWFDLANGVRNDVWAWGRSPQKEFLNPDGAIVESCWWTIPFLGR